MLPRPVDGQKARTQRSNVMCGTNLGAKSQSPSPRLRSATIRAATVRCAWTLRGFAADATTPVPEADACIALAEGMSGSEKKFASDVMTRRARELGLTRSTFGNSNGLPDPDNKMTVRELARLARHLILDFPEFYKLFNEREFTWNKIRQQNRNPLLNSLNGADGLKTGYTKEGGYGMVGSAVQNGTRLIVVVNGLDDPDDRAQEAKKMLEWGFRNFETRTLFAENQYVGYAKVFGGESRSVKLASKEPIKVMVPKNGSEKLIIGDVDDLASGLDASPSGSDPAGVGERVIEKGDYVGRRLVEGQNGQACGELSEVVGLVRSASTVCPSLDQRCLSMFENSSVVGIEGDGELRDGSAVGIENGLVFEIVFTHDFLLHIGQKRLWLRWSLSFFSKAKPSEKEGAAQVRTQYQSMPRFSTAAINAEP